MLKQEILVRCDICLDALECSEYAYVIDILEKRELLCKKCHYVAKRLEELKLLNIKARQRVSVGSLLDEQSKMLLEGWERYYDPRTSSIRKKDNE